ncbi:hypothetical protein B7R54_14865 [Subtercola boreus]|uniref:Uncharacterized protein n=1 Tax=Subtercola boreus TaxID=120213 RepID=A0A3E0VLK1_9MICO|nr:hypothetical protein B7R54_14865 [Subtercola boreus]
MRVRSDPVRSAGDGDGDAGGAPLSCAPPARADAGGAPPLLPAPAAGRADPEGCAPLMRSTGSRCRARCG